MDNKYAESVAPYIALGDPSPLWMCLDCGAVVAREGLKIHIDWHALNDGAKSN